MTVFTLIPRTIRDFAVWGALNQTGPGRTSLMRRKWRADRQSGFSFDRECGKDDKYDK
jgi:hypothetical protein